MNDNRPERSLAAPLYKGNERTHQAHPGGERIQKRSVGPSLFDAACDEDQIGDEQQRVYNHRLPPRSTDAIQAVRLGRREIERVHVLMGILDRWSKK